MIEESAEDSHNGESAKEVQRIVGTKENAEAIVSEESARNVQRAVRKTGKVEVDALL